MCWSGEWGVGDEDFGDQPFPELLRASRWHES